jgi:hypothetical protein
MQVSHHAALADVITNAEIVLIPVLDLAPWLLQAPAFSRQPYRPYADAAYIEPVYDPRAPAIVIIDIGGASPIASGDQDLLAPDPREIGRCYPDGAWKGVDGRGDIKGP